MALAGDARFTKNEEDATAVAPRWSQHQLPIAARRRSPDSSPAEGWAPRGEHRGPKMLKMLKMIMVVRVRIFGPARTPWHPGTMNTPG